MTTGASKEAIHNAIGMAETLCGNQEHCIEARPLNKVRKNMEKFYHVVLT